MLIISPRSIKEANFDQNRWKCGLGKTNPNCSLSLFFYRDIQQSSILVPPCGWKDVVLGASLASGVESVGLVISQSMCATSIMCADKIVHSWHRTGLHFAVQVWTFRSFGRHEVCWRRYVKKGQRCRQSCRNCSSRANSAGRTQCPWEHYLCFSFSVYLLLRQSLLTPSSRLPNQG